MERINRASDRTLRLSEALKKRKKKKRQQCNQFELFNKSDGSASPNVTGSEGKREKRRDNTVVAFLPKMVIGSLSFADRFFVL